MKNLNYLSFDAKKRRFGAEIEVNRNVSQDGLRKIIDKPYTEISGWGYTNNNSRWVIKTDSSCGDSGKKSDGGGYEVVSPAKSGIDHFWEIGIIAKRLKNANVRINDHCGFHCNVEIKDFQHDELAVLVGRWVKIERVIANIAHPRRSQSPTNLYCVLFRDKYKKEIEESNGLNKFDFWKIVKPKGLDTTYRRTSITIVNYLRSVSNSYGWDSFDRYTVELRIPEGSLEFNDVLNWTRLFVQFVNTCKNPNTEFPVDLNKNCSINESFKFLGLSEEKDNFAILSSGLLSTKIWMLERILKFGTDESLKIEAKQILSEIVDEKFPLLCTDPETNQIVKKEKKTKKKKLKPVKPKLENFYPVYDSF